jgi:hypothetical protein
MAGPDRDNRSSRTRCELAAAHLLRSARTVIRLAAKANYNPMQPRVPRGRPDGGRWTKVPGSGLPLVRVQSGPRRPSGPRGGIIRPGARLEEPSPAQLARLEAARIVRDREIARVREVDPRWKPAPQAYETIEGEIAANESEAREAIARLRELAQRGIGPGPYAIEWLPARGAGRDFRQSERDELNRISRRYGCHTCGTTDPGTRRGNFVIDHQLPARLAVEPYRLYPQCISCSDRQGGYVLNLLRRRD